MRVFTRPLLPLVVTLMLVGLPWMAAHATDNAFQPLEEVAGHLDKGWTAILEGKDPAEALAPWKVKVEAEDLEKLKAKAKEAKVASARCVFMEFEPRFYKGEDAVYRVRMQLWTTSEGCWLVDLKVYEGEDAKTWGEQGEIPLDTVSDVLGPFTRTGKALVAALEGEGWKTLPFVDLEVVKKALGDAIPMDKARRDLEEAQKRLPGVAAKVAELEYDRVTIYLDDQGSIGLDAEGNTVGGFNGEFEPAENGGLTYQLKGFRSRP